LKDDEFPVCEIVKLCLKCRRNYEGSCGFTLDEYGCTILQINTKNIQVHGGRITCLKFRPLGAAFRLKLLLKHLTERLEKAENWLRSRLKEKPVEWNVLYVCENCGQKFTKSVGRREITLNVICPHCGGNAEMVSAQRIQHL